MTVQIIDIQSNSRFENSSFARSNSWPRPTTGIAKNITLYSLHNTKPVSYRSKLCHSCLHLYLVNVFKPGESRRHLKIESLYASARTHPCQTQINDLREIVTTENRLRWLISYIHMYRIRYCIKWRIPRNERPKMKKAFDILESTNIIEFESWCQYILHWIISNEYLPNSMF